jgi:hypothetical protein
MEGKIFSRAANGISRAYRHFGLIPCFYAGRNTALWLAENISLSLLSTL